MKSKETIILVGAIVLLGAFIYLYEQHTIGTDEKARMADRILPDFKREMVTRIEIKSPKGSFVVKKQEAKKEKKKEKEKDKTNFEKELRTWNLLSPFKTAADISVVDGILSDLEFMSEERRVEGENAKKRKKFGLDTPQVTIKLTMNKKPVTLLVGKEAPGEGMYMLRENKKDIVYIVSKYTIESFIKDPSDVRDKQLMDFLPARLKSIIIYKGGFLHASFEKAQGKWTCTAPGLFESPVRVSRKMAHQLGSLVGSLRAMSFISDEINDAELSLYGLKENPVRVILEAEGGRKAEILLGGECGGETKGTEGMAAFIKKTGTLACVGLDVQHAVDRPLEEYRLLSAIEFDEYDVTSFEAFSGKKLILRLESNDENNWEITKPEKSEADNESVNAFILFLKNQKAASTLQAESDITAAGIDGAAKSKFIFYDVDKEILETVFIAGTSSDKFFFRRDGENAWSEIAGASNLLNAHKPFYFYKKSVISKEYLSALRYSVEGKNPRFYHKLTKKEEGGKWIFFNPAGLEPDPADTRDSIETFATLTAQRFLAVKSDANMSRFGLDTPSWTVKAAFSGAEEEENQNKSGGEQTCRLLIGKKLDDGYAAALENDSRPVIFLITEAVFKRLTRPLASRDVFQIQQSRIERLILTRKKTSVEFKAGAGGLEYHGGNENLFDPETVLKFIEKLSMLRAGDVVAYGAPGPERGFNNPSLQVTFTIKEETAAESKGEAEKTFLFGKKVVEENAEQEEVFAVVDGLQCTYTVGIDVLEALGIEL